MKITKIEYFQVVVPMKPGTVNSPEYGPAEFDEKPIHILRVITDEGVVGIGETSRGTNQKNVKDASYVHACAVAESCTLPSDIVGNFLREDDLIVEPLEYQDGNVLVPRKFGLGVELDQEALDKYTTLSGVVA